jgi:hypothetical protein
MLSENLFSGDKDGHATTNLLVTGVDVPTLNIDKVRSAEPDNHKASAEWMHQESATSATSGV